MDLINLRGGRRTPYIPQSESSECGLACLAMVASFHGLTTDVVTLRRHHSVSGRGMTLAQLMEVASHIGFNVRALRGDIDALPHLSLPAILHWNLSHFVVLTRISRGLSGAQYHIHDPAGGVRKLSRTELSKHFTGVAVDLAKSERFRALNQESQLRITHLWSSLSGLWPTMLNVLALSIVMQLAVLAAPLYSQIAIDSAYGSGDRDLLKVLVLGFLMLAVVSLAANWIRSLVIVALNNALSYQIVVNLFRHLTRLSLPWFERRHVGDIISRFSSTQPITQLISQGMVAAFVDGVMALFTVVLLFIYSIPLALIATGAFALYAGVRVAFLHALRLRNVDVITTAARENSVFIESVRGIAAIKAFGQETNRQQMWQKTKADAVNAQVKLGRLMGAFDAIGTFIPAAERVIFVYVAVNQALDGNMTLGMIFAYQAYKQQFLDAGIRLIEQMVNFKIIRVHLNRISDIVLSKPEEDLSDRKSPQAPDFSQGLKLKDVRFRYGSGDPEVLKGVNIELRPDEMIALIGPSGGGKTTLVKIMMGLLEPTYGSVMAGERPLAYYSRSAARRSMGIVSQDDTLFAGTLADNISFFDPQIDMQLVEAAAKQACIHTDIQSFPLGYDTLVGDMGSVLSGGQKQRIFLARALYAQPKILFLDEGTAHLDPHSEAAVIRSLKALKIPRVIVAHRLQSIEAADRVFIVSNGTAFFAPREQEGSAKGGAKAPFETSEIQ